VRVKVPLFLTLPIVALVVVLILPAGVFSAEDAPAITQLSGLVSLWDGDSVSGTTVYDTWGHNDGILQNGATAGPGMVGQALCFDGDNDYVVVADDPSLDLDYFAFSAWVHPTMSSSDLEGRYIVDKRDFSRPGYPGTFLVYVRGNGEISTTVYLGDGSSYVYHISDVGVVPMNQWSHVYVDWDGSTHRLYVDGHLVGTDSGAGVLARNGIPVTFGVRSDLASISYWKGKLDEVALFDRPLAEAEIQILHAVGSTQNLISVLQDMHLPRGLEDSLVAKLDSALLIMQMDGTGAASNMVEAFVRQVEAQRGKALTDGQANELIGMAQQIVGSF
jgi:hypothetical protein